MKGYLDKKKIKFEDERLNCAINMTSLAPYGAKQLDRLFNVLTCEAITAINSRQCVTNIPLKDGYYMNTMLDDLKDPSYNSTFQKILLTRGDDTFAYKFHLSQFHKKMYFDSRICEIIKTDGNDELYKNCFIFSFNVNNSCLSTFSVKSKDKRVNIEKLLNEYRPLLNSREYYINYDKEVYKRYLPLKYKFYDGDNPTMLEFIRIHEKCKSLFDHIYDILNCEDEDKYNVQMEVNLIMREIEQLDYKVEPEWKLIYDAWRFSLNYRYYTRIEYDDWVKSKDSISKIKVDEIESIPVSNESNYVQKPIYSTYNPNRIRYDEEDEDIDIGNKKNVNKKY